MPSNRQERLQKVMAHAGVASRRASEALIEQGRVTVNGQVVTQLGTKVNPRRDLIAVDNQPISLHSEKTVYIMLNKPAGVLSTARDDRGRKTVLDLVDVPERVYPVGRLDLHSEGLILLTNDGDLAEKLTHPRYHLEKEYHVLVAGHPSPQTLTRWSRGGLEVQGKPTVAAVIERLKRGRDNTWLKVILTEGRKRQIRDAAHMLGHPVKRLERVRIGPLQLGRLKSGRWRYLNIAEQQSLKQAVQGKIRKAVPGK